jgi:two-component system, chemotaxis family, chemotaxis protein CheY
MRVPDKVDEPPLYHGPAAEKLCPELSVALAVETLISPAIREEAPVKKVLVVDDSETIRLEVSRTLGQAGFVVIEARDGAEGLAVATKNADLALLILDVNMPVMNGLEMLERLRQNPTTADMPVLLMTTEAEDRLIERAKKAGAKGWFIKPVKPEMLLMATNKLAR